MRFIEHLKKNIILALPVMLTQAGQISVNIIDNIMVGSLGGRMDWIKDDSLSRTALAACSLGNSIFITIMVLAFGFSFALCPLIAAEDAKGNKKKASSYFIHSLVLNVILSILLTLIIILGRPLLFYFNQPVDVIEKCIPFLTIMTWSMIPLMIFQTLREFSEGLSLTLPVTIATILGNLINIVLNYGWIYGYMGFLRLELDGAAWGTLVSRIFMLIFLLIILFRLQKTRSILSVVDIRKFKKEIFKKISVIGIPTAMTSFFEITAFSVAAFVCGYVFTDSLADQELAKVNLAAHQISINLAASTFMMCIGLGVAATVRVGNQLGLKDYKTLREAGWSCILMAMTIMIIFGVLMILFRYDLPLIYLDDPQVTKLAAQLLIVAAFFQLSDGIQLTAYGALRGITDVKIPTLITFISYWIIAMPLGILLAIYYEMRAMGMWIGLGVGLTCSSIFLLIRFNIKTKQLLIKSN